MKRRPHPKKPLEEHPLVEACLANLESAIPKMGRRLKRMLEEGAKSIEAVPSELDRIEGYHSGVFYALSAAIGCMTRLRQIQRLLRNYPKRLARGRTAISRYDWLAIQYSNHVVALVSSYDIALLLVNEVVRLGLAPRTCRTDTVAENWWVKGTPVRVALAKVEAISQRHAKERHLFVHRGEMARPEERLESDHVRWLPIYEHSFEGVALEQEAHAIFRLERPRLLRAMQEDVALLESALSGLFDSLGSPYNMKTKLTALIKI